ncbi:MAG TPA: hypothetical protein PLO37_01800 [Candidatus Hydrogenedentes bacterium]|nr:hypothetical protein [Candidatus Hydrogenedentota bacterium]
MNLPIPNHLRTNNEARELNGYPEILLNVPSTKTHEAPFFLGNPKGIVEPPNERTLVIDDSLPVPIVVLDSIGRICKDRVNRTALDVAKNIQAVPEVELGSPLVEFVYSPLHGFSFPGPWISPHILNLLVSPL